jgi:hypothetical protein
LSPPAALWSSGRKYKYGSSLRLSLTEAERRWWDTHIRILRDEAAMQKKWDVEPVQVAAMVIEHFPNEAELIVLDFLEGSTKGANANSTVFWTMVLNHLEKMQMALADEPSYGRPLRVAV